VSSQAELDITIVDGVAKIVFQRPNQLNAIPLTTFDKLAEVYAGIAQNRLARCVVLAGQGPCFSAGADIGSFPRESGDATKDFVRRTLRAFRAVVYSPVPTICAVHGIAFGGGFEFVLASDIVIADETARFALPETSLGVVPGVALLLGPRRVPAAVLAAMVYGGLELEGRQAAAFGVVSELVPAGDHLKRALELATAVAARSEAANRQAKTLASMPSEMDFDRVQAAVLDTLQSPDTTARLDAFLARRRRRTKR
jgi:enoyl-CoA hydratase